MAEDGTETNHIPAVYYQGGVYSNIVDGDVTTIQEVIPDKVYQFDSDRTRRTDVYYDFIFRLDGTYKDLKFLFVDATSANLRTTKYSIFASTSSAKLFTSAPVAENLKNTNQFNSVDLKGVVASYIGIRVYETWNGLGGYSYDSLYPRVGEMALKGEPTHSILKGDSLDIIDVPADDIATSKNALLGSTFEAGKTAADLSAGAFTVALGSIDAEGNETTAAHSVINSASLPSVVDGNMDTASMIKLNAGSNYTFWKEEGDGVARRTDLYYDIIFNLGAVRKLETLYIQDASQSKLYMSDFSVYIADSADKLYSGIPAIYHEAGSLRYNLFDLKNKTAKYLAIRVYGACNESFASDAGVSETYVRLAEVALLSELTHTAIKSDTFEDLGLDASELLSNNAVLGSNFEAGKTLDDVSDGSYTIALGAIDENGNETTTACSAVNPDTLKPANLVDGSVDTASIIKLDSGSKNTFWKEDEESGAVSPRTDLYYDIIFNLGALHDLECLYIQDASQSKLYMTDFCVYVAENKEELFEGFPAVYHETGSLRYNVFDLAGKTAQFIAIRVYGACNESFAASGGIGETYLRLAEIALFTNRVGTSASAKLDSPEKTSLTSATVSKSRPEAGDTITFSTTNENEDLYFECWKDAEGEVFSNSPTFSVEVKEGDSSILYTAVYKLKDHILIKENLEGSTTIGGLSALTKGTASEFGITPRKGYEKSKILKYSCTEPGWGYLRFTNNGVDLFKDYALEANTAYKFSYWYYVENISDASKPIFFTLPHKSFKHFPNEDGDTRFVKQDGPFRVMGDKTGEWIKKEIFFYSYDLPQLCNFVFYSAGNNCSAGTSYIDDIKLEKATVIDLEMDETDVITTIGATENFVSGNYYEKFGSKLISTGGRQTIAPAEGRVITSVTLDGETLTPNSDGTYALNLGATAKLSVKTASKENWAQIIVDQKSGTGKFVQITENGANLASKIGESYSFKFITGENANPVVSVGNDTLSAVNGVYTIPKVSGDTTVKIVCQGDEYRGKGGVDAKGNDLTKYVKELYDIPLWEGDIMYHETVTIYKGRTTARLLYPIDEIISVRSFNLKKEYIWGVDYDINEKGELVLLEGNSFPCYKDDLSKPSDSALTDEGYLQKYMIDVTFKHSKTWEDGYQKDYIESGINQLPKLYEKLQNKENVELMFYGASSTVGWSSSGLNEYVVWDNGDGTSYERWDTIMIAPYIPTWARQTHGLMRSIWGYDEEGSRTDITFINRSCGGKTAAMAANEVTLASQFKDTCPDVVVLGFSGNDGLDTTYISNLKKIITYVRANVNPDCEFIVASSSLPANEKLKGYSLARIPELQQMCKDYEGQGVIYAPTLDYSNTVFSALTGCDYTAQNYNHNNDFGSRAFTSVMAGLLSKPDAPQKFEVVFKDVKGEIVYKTTLTEGETAEAAAKTAQANLQKNYGYTFLGWSVEPTAAITEATEFTTVYKRDTALNYTLSIDGEAKENVSFDSKINLTANSKVLWKINGEKFSIGESSVVYAFGSISATTESAEGLDENEPFVSLLATVKDAEDGQFIAFVHTYDPQNTITEYGASFWNAANLMPTEFKNCSFTEGNDAMITLYGILAGRTRGVKAFAKVGSEVIYSESEAIASF